MGQVELLASAASAADSKTGAPTVSSPVEMDWGSMAAQMLRNETAIIEAAAAGGMQVALSAMPFGSIVSMFIGPKVVKQYIDQGLTLLEGVLDGQKLIAGSAVETYVFTAINTYEPLLAKELGDQLTPLIQSLLAKVGVKI